ncbi:anti-sigma factor [Nocardioides baculatus]|uniref:VCBS repeat-containing protein n=1 Tax=Nocardioides baculatus TaxID=2801337 RepID=A0ABS1LER5_9ACTN|nr:anti-sigma factor [Nocardioides baculatus]MBL0749482.1 hypothetical protein [Nocardioides baculatus]
MSTDIEARLRDALAARADLVRPEDLEPLAPVVELRPRLSRQSPWVLLATAAVVLLVLGIVFQGVGGRERSDRLAPEPDEKIELQLPTDVGRDWKADDISTPARLDLDGDGTKEKVVFLGEPTKNFDGRTRLQTTLSSTGQEAFGIAELGTTIGTSALPPIDADGDGDQELVLLRDEAYSGPVTGGFPIVFDLRDGLLVEAVPDEPGLLIRGELVEEGSATEYYDKVRVGDFWIEDGTLHSSRSVASYARGAEMRFSPKAYVVDAWTWTLDDNGALRHGETECLVQSYDSTRECGLDPTDTFTYLPPERASYVGLGETVDLTDEAGYGFTARIEADADPSLVVNGFGASIRQPLEVPQPMLGTVQPTSIFFDGASLVITSATDPSVVQVFTQNDDRMVLMDPVGEIDLAADDGQQTWLTDNGAVLSALPADDGAWELWQWVMVSRTEIAALPWATVCIDDVDDPTAITAC